MKLNSDTLLSFGVFGLGLVAIGYAVGIHSRMKAVADKLDMSQAGATVTDILTT